MELFAQLASAVAVAGRADDRQGSTAANLARPAPLFGRLRDERTGQTYLTIKMPDPEVVDRTAAALQALLESVRA